MHASTLNAMILCPNKHMYLDVLKPLKTMLTAICGDTSDYPIRWYIYPFVQVKALPILVPLKTAPRANTALTFSQLFDQAGQGNKKKLPFFFRVYEPYRWS